jgi:hypothetical protein
LPVLAADGERGGEGPEKDDSKKLWHLPKYFLYGLDILFKSRARSLRGDSITDGRSKPDFVLEILVRPNSSSATSTEQPIIELHGEVDSFKTV